MTPSKEQPLDDFWLCFYLLCLLAIMYFSGIAFDGGGSHSRYGAGYGEKQVPAAHAVAAARGKEFVRMPSVQLESAMSTRPVLNEILAGIGNGKGPVVEDGMPLVIREFCGDCAGERFFLVGTAFFERLKPTDLQISFAGGMAVSELIPNDVSAFGGDTQKDLLSFMF